jgi:SAM-dependent methyltransferase
MRLRRRTTEVSPGPTPVPVPTIDERYVREAPSAQLAVDLFKGEWTTALPEHLGVHAGTMPLMEDPRIDWILQQAGGVDGRQVLELGPLEAAHTYMLEEAGASVTAIESNTRAYLRCLVVKELLNLRNSTFMLGDFVPYMESTDRRFDLVLASGVLYHSPDPLRLLTALARVTDRVGIWTHYYDPPLMQATAVEVVRFFPEVDTAEIGGRSVNLHRRNYFELRDNQAFCGGPEATAVWLELEDLLHVLSSLGFTRNVIGDNDLQHAAAPAVLLYAEREHV